jgi:hypothetical protein
VPIGCATVQYRQAARHGGVPRLLTQASCLGSRLVPRLRRSGMSLIHTGTQAFRPRLTFGSRPSGPPEIGWRTTSKGIFVSVYVIFNIGYLYMSNGILAGAYAIRNIALPCAGARPGGPGTKR